MADRLDTYRSKRDAGRTSEPVPAAGGTTRRRSSGPRFVVQEHHATRLHWDLRLERDGVLVSWALPKYLPPAPGENVVAIRTEDHPLEYVDFEGEIPKGEYGAGTMEIVDAGTFEEILWEDRKVEVRLRGALLDAEYALFPIERDGDPSAEGTTWMIHRKDAPDARDAAALPERIAPMLARAGTLPHGDAWTFEVKWDGVRTLLHSRPGEWVARSRSLADVSVTFPELAAASRALGRHRAVLDGEVVAFGEDGTPSFGALQKRLGRTDPARVKRIARDVPVRYVVFDVVWLDGEDLTALPYEARRERLAALDLERHGAPVVSVPAPEDDGEVLLDASRRLGLEGVVAKRRDSPYAPGRRTDAWVKVKVTGRLELAIVGWTPGEGRRHERIGALLLALPDPDSGELRYAGRVGTGFTEATLDELRGLLGDRERADAPCGPSTGGVEPPRDARFAEPDLWCEVEFTEMTTDGVLRHPSYKGLVDRAGTELPEASGGEDPELAARPSSGAGRSAGEGTLVRAAGRELRVTNLDKPLWPDGTTKADVLRYAAEIADVVLPHLAGRPLTLRRWPDGTAGPTFYEKRAPSYRPEWVETATVRLDGALEEQLVASEPATLVWLANLAALELHAPLHRAGEDRDADGAVVPAADLVAFDLDPGPPATSIDCARVALLLRGMLGGLGLESAVKSSGSKGLQVYVPLGGSGVPYAETRAFSRAVAEVLAREEPDRIVARQAKAQRTGKVLVDWYQNDPSKTTVAVYSLRAAHDRPTVSAPLTWEEVEAAADGGDPEDLLLGPADVLRRVEAIGDPFAMTLSTAQSLPEG